MKNETEISAAEAARSFSLLLEGACQGRSFLIVAEDRQPIARIIPASTHGATERAARDALFQRLQQQRAKDGGGWSREELYDDE